MPQERKYLLGGYEITAKTDDSGRPIFVEATKLRGNGWAIFHYETGKYATSGGLAGDTAKYALSVEVSEWTREREAK